VNGQWFGRWAGSWHGESTPEVVNPPFIPPGVAPYVVQGSLGWTGGVARRTAKSRDDQDLMEILMMLGDVL